MEKEYKKFMDDYCRDIYRYCSDNYRKRFFIEKLPQTANQEYVLRKGIVEEYSMVGTEKYDLLILQGNKLYEWEDVFSDSLQRGDEVKIVFYPMSPYYKK